MKSSQGLFKALYGHLVDNTKGRLGLELELPIQGIDTDDELLKAIMEGRGQGVFNYAIKIMDGIWSVGLTDNAAKNLGR